MRFGSERLLNAHFERVEQASCLFTEIRSHRLEAYATFCGRSEIALYLIQQ